MCYSALEHAIYTGLKLEGCDVTTNITSILTNQMTSILGSLIFWTGWLAVRCTLGLFRPTKVIGEKKNLQGCICMAHTSRWDYVCLNLLVRTCPVLKSEIYDWAPWFFRCVGVIRLKRGDRVSAVSALRLSNRLQQNGRTILVFPEGTRGSQPAIIAPLPKGAAAFAQSSGQFVLVGVTGVRGFAWFYRRPVLVISRPYTKDNRPEKISDGWLREAMQEQQKKAYQTYQQP